MHGVRHAEDRVCAAWKLLTSAGSCICCNQTRRGDCCRKPRGNRACVGVCVRSMAQWEKDLWRLRCMASDAQTQMHRLAAVAISSHCHSAPFLRCEPELCACILCARSGEYKLVAHVPSISLSSSILISIQYPVSVSVSETLLNQYLSSFSNRQYSIHKWNIALCLSCSYLFHSFIQNHEFYYNRGGVKKII